MSVTPCLAILLLSFVSWQSAEAQILGFGSCPTQPTVVAGFDKTKYVGTWYENRKYFAIFELAQKCITATYTANPDGSITVLNKAKGILFGGDRQVTGTAIEASPGKLIVSFSGAPNPASAPNYWVLGTDYTNYAVVWGCTPLGPLNAQFAWILTRAKNPSADVINTALAVFNKNAISTTQLQLTDQTSC